MQLKRKIGQFYICLICEEQYCQTAPRQLTCSKKCSNKRKSNVTVIYTRNRRLVDPEFKKRLNKYINKRIKKRKKENVEFRKEFNRKNYLRIRKRKELKKKEK